MDSVRQVSKMDEDCRTCKHGKPMVGVIFCEKTNRIKTDTTKPCDDYKPKQKQITFED